MLLVIKDRKMIVKSFANIYVDKTNLNISSVTSGATTLILGDIYSKYTLFCTTFNYCNLPNSKVS